MGTIRELLESASPLEKSIAYARVRGVEPISATEYGALYIHEMSSGVELTVLVGYEDSVTSHFYRVPIEDVPAIIEELRVVIGESLS